MVKDNSLNRVLGLGIVLAALAGGWMPLGFADEGVAQAQLDAACEAARERRLAPERERYIEECVVTGQRPDRSACERFYADYGAQSGHRAPLYYDLPECVKAFEYRRSHSSR